VSVADGDRFGVVGPEGGDDGGLGCRVDGEEVEGAVLWRRIYLASIILYEKNNLWKNIVEERTCIEKFNLRSAMNHPAQRRHSPFFYTQMKLATRTGTTTSL
jgi:hypothetical protein